MNLDTANQVLDAAQSGGESLKPEPYAKRRFPRTWSQASTRLRCHSLDADFRYSGGISGSQIRIEIGKAKPSGHELAPRRIGGRNYIAGPIRANDMKVARYRTGIAICPAHVAADQNTVGLLASSRTDYGNIGIRY
ncbi:hypothetical protein ACFFF7_08195 [Novosphingobium aquiterrae]|uniref:Uncharacterized protein n=1 Tax=Novosphingobium aquiterrae TaxID=624388 RepID=A0ABV6PII6_9SPHN